MRLHLRLLALALAVAVVGGGSLGARRATAQTPAGTTTLPGYVLPGLKNASKVTHAAADAAAIQQQQIDLTIVLQRANEAGFQSYLKDVSDPKSANYGKYLSQANLTARYGPSQQAYDAVTAYLQQAGFTIVQGSANRLTITVSGTRADVEQAFNTTLSDYQVNGASFYANTSNPALPNSVASDVAGLAGLNSLAQARPAIGDAPAAPDNTFPATSPMALSTAYDFAGVSGATGAGQKIGLLEFDNYQLSDVQNWANWVGVPSSRVNQLSHVDVAGGSLASLGGGTDEVMLDIETVMGMAPGASYVVYDAPNNSNVLPATVGFEAIFNTMINDNVSVISNSWHVCETSIVSADLTTMDSILSQAAAAGIAVFSSSGDVGNGCSDSSNPPAGTGQFPADSAYNTAVGGTSLFVTNQGAYSSEIWWNNGTPSAGQGGYWTSAIEPRPAYQNVFVSGNFRSVPDVSADSGDGIGIVINGQHLCCFGGTSEAAPEWAAGMALIYDHLGHRLGDLNARLYAAAPSNAFHSAASMGSDFAHVGLGSFDLGTLYSQLIGAPGCGGTTAKPELIQPNADATLSGSSQTFCWSTASGVTGFSLLVGSQGPGSNNVANDTSLPATTTSVSVSSIPSVGQILFVRLTWTGTSAGSTDYRFVEQAGGGSLVWQLQPGCSEVAAVTSTPAGTTNSTLVSQVSPSGSVLGVWRVDPATQNEQAGYIAASGAPIDFSTYGPGNDLEVCVSQAATIPASAFTLTDLIEPVPMARFFGTAMLNGVAAPDFTSVNVWAGNFTIFCGSGSVKSDSYSVDVQEFTGCTAASTSLEFQIGSSAATQTSTVPAVPGGGINLNLTANGGSNTLTINVAGCGSTTPSGTSDQYQGTNISVTASACDGSHTFSGWTINGATCGSGNSNPTCAFSMPNNNVTLTATFAGSTPVMTSPTPSSTLSGTTVTFQWTPATGATAYWIWIGSTGVGTYNVSAGQQLSASTTSSTVAGLPTTGTLYVRLWYYVAGIWQSTDYSYTASGGSGTTYGLTIGTSGGSGCTTTPAAGTLQHSAGDAISVTANACTGYSLSGWTLTGISGVCTGTANPCTFTMPANAVTVTANFTASGGGGNQCPPAITSPTPNGSLPGSTVTFQWALCNQATGYWVYVGTQGAGSNDVSRGQQLPASATSYTVSGIPTGKTIYVRLWYLQGGSWPWVDFTYTGVATVPQLTVTASGCGTTSPSGTTSQPAGTNISITETPNSGCNFTGWSLTGGVNCTNGNGSSDTDCTFSMPNASVTVTATFVGPPQLTVNASGCGTTSPSGTNTESVGANISITETPNSGCTFSGWTLTGGVACANGNGSSDTDCTFSMPNNNVTVTATFTSPNSCPPALTTPPPHSTLPGSTVTFQWTPCSSATGYWVYVGSTGVGSSNISAGTQLSGTTNSTTVQNIPTSGTIYVRFWYFVGGTWLSTDYTYTGG